MTLGVDIGAIKRIITHAAAEHGLEIYPESVDLVRVARGPSAFSTRARPAE